ncbi:hypothetical protein BDQ94DRAFT_164334 [Aspergillus welwitschiae]|uniref:Uncharacterized protein n=1 Tax=Aspergillus welwitschiae TaxID=1341132 RepID=A0A3F3PI43_9EURO|nr:hypothetical protein BDQ94DRAFT_164334 [Aspergillus welwitschiae]RDH26621.1 hypothetical protein BDQ94DRAFT_164334 [Aspergillus welwitschiae]
MSDVSHPTESSPPDDRRPNFQAVSDESILTEKSTKSPVKLSPWLLPSESAAFLCDFELTESRRKLEEQVKHQDQENHRLHKRVSGHLLWKRNERRQAKEKGTERFSGQAGRGPTGQGLINIA